MILSKKALNLAEVNEYTKNQENNPVLADYLKAYGKLSLKEASELSEELTALNNMKMKEEHVVKIVDFLPKDSEDLSKIFNDVTLNEEETNSILAIVKKY